jgi:ATP-dependent RNA helicase HelY
LLPVAEYRQILFVADTYQVDVPEPLLLDVLSGLEPDPAMLRAVSESIDLDLLPDVIGEMDIFQQRAIARRAEQERDIRDEMAEVEADARALSEQIQHHPYHGHPKLAEFRGYLRRIDELEQERAALGEMLTRESEAEEQRVQSVIWGIREVLHRFGYMRRGFATEKADMLAGVFDNDGLILCEVLDHHLLDDVRPEDLAEIFSWYSFDRELRYANGFVLPPELTRARKRIEEIERAVINEEREHGLFISNGHNATFFGPARAWCLGHTMAELTDKIALSEGDLVLTFNKTIDLIRQVREMLEDVLDGHTLIGPLRRAENLLCRGIVEQSLNIGFAPLALAGGEGNGQVVANDAVRSGEASGGTPPH